MWVVRLEQDEYVVYDHNGDVQARFRADGVISTGDVKDVMRQRAGELKQDTVTAAKNQNTETAIANMTEWATIIEDMAGGRIRLPRPDMPNQQ